MHYWDHYWVEAAETCHDKDSCSETQGYIWNDEDKTCITQKDECKDREDHYWVEAKKTCYNKTSCSDTQGYIWDDEDKTCITKKDRSGVKGSFAAEIFCTMRDGGNDHESSWEAAYAYIKKQKRELFKVSPKQAASQITEAVIRDRINSSYCVEYLDQLHPNRQFIRDLKKKNKENKKMQKIGKIKEKDRRKNLKKLMKIFRKKLMKIFRKKQLIDTAISSTPFVNCLSNRDTQ